MSEQKPAWLAEDLSPAKLYLNYVIAGAIVLGLVGLLVGLAVHLAWLAFVGLALGVVAGALLARMHVAAQRRDQQNG